MFLTIFYWQPTLVPGSHVLLVQLDLFAASDTVDQEILLTRLNLLVGLQGTALEWFEYFKNRSFIARLGKFVSEASALHCSVPQGSILGPLLFNLYILPLASIF